MSLNTKTYSKLLRETAKQNGVELFINGRWTDGLGPSRRTIGQDRVVTFRINTTTGNFDKFIKELSTMTLLKSGKAPRYTAPRGYYTSEIVENGGTKYRQRSLASGQHTYIKFNCKIA
jgi:hypothetical protein